MKEQTMTQFKEALEVAINTQQELTLRSQPEANRILIKSLGQILNTLKENLKQLDGNTP
tara:strand:- start:146 stop:322 length:177 start_codon:yes stop_codon:yes gene_type:complete